MPKSVQTQWEFGELFGPAATRPVLSVSDLTAKVRSLLERGVGRVWVTGEVSNLRQQASGHIYFTLKDPAAQLSCVLFRSEVVANRALLRDGQKVLLEGDLTVYEARGQYQFLVRAVELQGLGALQIAFERLKQKLQAEGLFAPERKRPLPKYPQRIGLVTSSSGAALRDVVHVIRRRQPSLKIVLASCRVQGEGAGHEIACAINLLNEWSFGAGRLPASERQIDLILVTRGGGSLEDLWAFNEEVVARAIFNSRLPVISGVGHEIDFTISDFVADVRAATPSAAAEIITEGPFACRKVLLETCAFLSELIKNRLEESQQTVAGLKSRLDRVHPRRIIRDRMQFMDDLQASLSRCTRQEVRRLVTSWQILDQRLARVRPSVLLRQRKDLVRQLARRLRELAKARRRECVQHVSTLAGRLRLLGPENVLARGYSITRNVQTGKVVRDPAEVASGQHLLTHVHRGKIRSVVEGK